VVSAVQWVSTGNHNYTGFFNGVRRLLVCSAVQCSDLNLVSHGSSTLAGHWVHAHVSPAQADLGRIRTEHGPRYPTQLVPVMCVGCWDVQECERVSGKFLRNKLPSAHVFAMYQLGGTLTQTFYDVQCTSVMLMTMMVLMIMVCGGWTTLAARAGQNSSNFFEHDLTNHVPELGTASPVALRLLRTALAAASNYPAMGTPPSLFLCAFVRG
jgi:hypothetical protein